MRQLEYLFHNPSKTWQAYYTFMCGRLAQLTAIIVPISALINLFVSLLYLHNDAFHN